MSTLLKASSSPRRRASSAERNNPYAPIERYYNDAAIRSSLGRRLRAVGTFANDGPATHFELDRTHYPRRRASHDEYTQADQQLLVNVDRTIADLLRREDQDHNSQITIEDNGPKHISIGTLASAGFHTVDLRGNYVISNLLQELTLAKDLGLKYAKIHKARLQENPVDRLTRRIRDEFWKNLERRLDASLIEKAGKDPKDWTEDPRPRIYIPHGCPDQLEYYQGVATASPDIRLDVRSLPPGPYSAEFVQSLNDAPGILALAMRKETINGIEAFRGEPFTVPGGRFNELYGWDSYMIAVGLIAQGKVEMAKSMAINFAFCIEHYGKILNANRSYYLMRSQPPFLTEMALRIFDKIRHEPGALDFLQHMTQAAIKEYYNVWMSPPRYDNVSGLSRYRPGGKGVPPETEASHFVHVIEPYAKRQNMTFDDYVKAYNAGQVIEPELDMYLLHDRAVRESGHDTSYRLECVAADLATVDLNSLLYKYESDISYIIRTYFKDHLPIPPNFQTEVNRIDGYEASSTWDRRAKLRKIRMEKFMWDPAAGMFFDYNTLTKQRTDYESATTFWTMWAGLATPKQAASLVLNALPKFEEFGGLVSGTKKSRGEIHLARPNRQWDYPFGWAPQQILAWEGLQRYGYHDDVQRLAYKWLYMVIKAFVDFNGVVVEKYDVTREVDPHKVEAEYGNQGADFKGVPREGFGWVNASFIYGLSYLPMHMKRALGTITPWSTFYAKTRIEVDELSELAIVEESENVGSTLSTSDSGT